MEVARYWRLNGQRYGLQGTVCACCGKRSFAQRMVCVGCGEARAADKETLPVEVMSRLLVR